MGHLFCLDPQTARVIWQKNYVKDFDTDLPTWGIASHPLVDGDRLIAIVGGKNNAGVVAFNRHTGKEIWRNLSIGDIGYAPPVIYKAGGVRQLIVWHPEELLSLNPDTGHVYWRVPFHTTMGVSIMTPLFDDPLLFVSQSWEGPLMMKLAKDKPSAKVLWRLPPDGNVDDDLVNCLMSTPILRDGYIYGISLYGELRCLEARTGRRMWQTYEPTGHARWWNAFLIPNRDRVFIHNEQGELIVARLSPKGYQEISRAKLIQPTSRLRRRNLVWSHPAFANKSVYARNDKEIICVPLNQ
jgi:outer membrane protein assembly factor BamB